MRILSLFLLPSLTACEISEQTPREELIERAQQRVAYQLVDPESAQFRISRVSVEHQVVCGEVNGRNGFGGYAGFTEFSYIKGRILIAELGSNIGGSGPYSTLVGIECFNRALGGEPVGEVGE